jgi:transcriptional regulator
MPVYRHRALTTEERGQNPSASLRLSVLFGGFGDSGRRSAPCRSAERLGTGHNSVMYLSERYHLDLNGARNLIDRHSRACVVTAGAEGLRATYGFFLLEPPSDPDDLTVIGHLARADPQVSALSSGAETLLVFDGPHGYISASWYAPTLTKVPGTWNYSAVHLRGVPEPVPVEQAFDVVRRTVERNEAPLPPEEQWSLSGEAYDFAQKIVAGVFAFRLRATSVEAKAKLSQEMPAEIQQRVQGALRQAGPHQNVALADSMAGTQ